MKKQNGTNITNDDIETTIELEYKMAEDGMLYPNISFESENLADLGKYGLMAMDYLKDNYYDRYRSLERSGRLVEILKPVNEEAHQMVVQMMEKYLKKRVKNLRCTQVCKSRYFTNENTETQVDVQMNKPSNPVSTMEMWKKRGQGLMQAEEIVVNEIVNTYH